MINKIKPNQEVERKAVKIAESIAKIRTHTPIITGEEVRGRVIARAEAVEKSVISSIYELGIILHL